MDKKTIRTGLRSSIAGRWMFNTLSVVGILLVIANVCIYYFTRQYYYGSAENYVVSEVAKSYLNCGVEPYMYYYRDKDMKEIDIVLEHDGILNPIEIKKTANPGTELTRVFAVLDKGAVPRGNGAIICMKPELSAIDRNNFIVPIWMI